MEAAAAPAASGALHQMGKDTVQRLCAGQVVVDLATSVKELLENSLDAGATFVDIKLRDSGLTSITVADNGQGIDSDGFATLCRRHWTSKIQRFEDLESVATFGFRGEALSSLCTVASVSVTTATRESAPMGVQLEYTGDGELASQSAVARERGTTVCVAGLFEKWPVRQQDLRKNVRREYLRLVSLVEQYAIISDGVRLSLANQTKGGSSTVGVRTMPNTDRLTRMLAVCGAALRPHLVHIEHRVEGTGDADPGIAIEGHISRPLPEAGRGASDKQYFFVNGRPCDFPRAKRLINELYRSHSPTRFPVFAIAITIDSASVDVNLTPDKRTILIRHEPQLLEVLRLALTRVFEPDESLFSVSRVQTQLVPASLSTADSDLTLPTPPILLTPPTTDAAADDGPGAPPSGDRRPAASSPQMVVAPTSFPGVVRCFVNDPSGASGQKRHAEEVSESHEPSRAAMPKRSGRKQSLLAAPAAGPARDMDVDEPPAPRAAQPRHQRGPGPAREAAPTTEAAPARSTVAAGASRPRQSSARLPTVVIGVCRSRRKDDTHDWSGVRQRLRAKQAREAQRAEESQQHAADETDAELEQGGIGNASDPERACSALSRLIHKRDFASMSVLGQFNHGFIIARLGHDLYIVDQHASDEKFNFEQLQQRATISSQPLIRPATLELSVVDESVAIEFQDVLERNGFHIRVHEAAEPGRRVSLLTQPFIDQTLFTQQDLLELIGRLSVCPEAAPRCERARRMFASRACRKSIMIGDPLTQAQMRTVVHHLSELDHPWNCPHGRPTMRHLYRMPS
ncbi:ATP-binding mismatch repair protein [Coemansia biformis]|uniref:ATP-binding mismatch repair protein n=1 Tax=Coemansia biformis TaxID=1286918 RepID=A0A9W7YDH9_9FUNG|nr:ATP-binding mismatch repair protein [Coemansia biformis]